MPKTRLAKYVKCVPAATLAFTMAAYGVDCLGMATPEQAMQCCRKMHCHSHHHRSHHGSQDCCKNATQMQVALGQPSSIQVIVLTPVALRAAHVFSDSHVAKCPTDIVARHSHDPPSSYATPVLSDHLKTGQRRSGQNRPTREAGTRLFYSADSFGGKFVFVRQLRGPHLSTCP